MSLQFGNKQTPYLEKLYKETKNAYFAGAYFSKKKQRLIRYSCNHKDYKRIANRKVRNLDQELAPKGKQYKKYYDLMWEVM